MKFNKHFSDALMIIFSVLFALFINKMAENYQTNKSKKVAEKNILIELQNNQTTIQGWLENHNQIKEGIEKLVKNQDKSLQDSLLKQDYFDLSLFSNAPNLANSSPTSTAWETTKSTGLISEFDFQDVQLLTNTYSLQNVIIEETFKKIMNKVLNYEQLSSSNLESMSNHYYMLFRELVGQEQYLLQHYKTTIQEIKK